MNNYRPLQRPMQRLLSLCQRSSANLRRHSLPAAFCLTLLIVPLVASCSSSEPSSTPEPPSTSNEGDLPVLMSEAVTTYADGVHSSYSVSLASAQQMDQAIDRFLAAPSPASLDGAKRAWLRAREDYGPTEAFRFYGGPIDNDETGTEGLINAWPLDESYIDYVVGNPSAGIINNPDEFPVIDADLILSLNEEGGEANVSTGWHAIEFLLWGQDLSEDGPGVRPFEDYTTNPNAARRSTYLSTASDVLIGHLSDLQAAWAPGGGNYRSEFLELDPTAAMANIITGIGELSRGELAGERMNVAYSERSEEDEHSCFSDNTNLDIVANALGIQMVLLGEYPGGVSGTGVLDVVDAADSDLADRLRAEVSGSLTVLKAIPAPFDQHLREDVSDDAPGRRSVLAGIETLEAQTETIVAAAAAMGVEINVS